MRPSGRRTVCVSHSPQEIHVLYTRDITITSTTPTPLHSPHRDRRDAVDSVTSTETVSWTVCSRKVEGAGVERRSGSRMTPLRTSFLQLYV